ncbi:MAG TPA: hypothetical protein VGK50_06780 [Coriobacteriia bacterium]
MRVPGVDAAGGDAVAAGDGGDASTGRAVTTEGSAGVSPGTGKPEVANATAVASRSPAAAMTAVQKRLSCVSLIRVRPIALDEEPFYLQI